MRTMEEADDMFNYLDNEKNPRLAEAL